MSTTRSAKNRSNRDRNIWLERLTALVFRVETAGILLTTAGFLLLSAPLTRLPATLTERFFYLPLRFSDANQGAATFVAVAVAVLLGIFVLHLRQSEGRADGLVRARNSAPRRASLVPVLGVMAMVIAGALISLGWMAHHSAIPTSELTLAVGERVETFRATDVGRNYKVMLPMRMELSAFDLDERTATIRFSRPGEGAEIEDTLTFQESLDVEGFRFSLVGTQRNPRVLRGVFSHEDENTIAAVGSRGQSVTFAIDGPSYSILAISPNHLGVLGPAVQLESPEGETFWVYQNTGSDTHQARFRHGVILERLETAPVAVLTVSQARNPWWLAPGGVFFLIGFAAFLFVTDRRRVEAPDGFWLESVNDAGEVAFEEGLPTGQGDAE